MSIYFKRFLDRTNHLSLRNKVKRCEGAIEAYRQEIDNRKAENYGFASMAAVPYAHIVAHMLRDKRPKGTIVTLAPNPKDIVRISFFLTVGIAVAHISTRFGGILASPRVQSQERRC